MLSRLNVLIMESFFTYLTSLKGKWSVKETGLKIPLIIRWPKIIKEGISSNQIVSVIDIPPTIIDIAEAYMDLMVKVFSQF